MIRWYPTAEYLSGVALPALRDVHPFFGMVWLAMKEARLPVGTQIAFNFSRHNRAFLQERYRPSQRVERFYSPYRTATTGWVSLEHSRTTLQRIAADTFGDCFLHAKNTHHWGWAPDAVERLRSHLGQAKLPALPLAAWLFVREGLPERSPSDAIKYLFEKFNITLEEQGYFDVDSHVSDWAVENAPISDAILLALLPPPPDARPTSGAALQALIIRDLGPIRLLEYRPSDRVNLLTGDNNLGKTLLLEAAWAALTGGWRDSSLLPFHLGTTDSVVDYQLMHGARSRVAGRVRYRVMSRSWEVVDEPDVLPGLVLYARSEGSYSFHDPVRRVTWRFSRKEVWEGLRIPVAGADLDEVVSEGALRDLLMWELNEERYGWHCRTFRECLRVLSPDPNRPLQLAAPQRLPGGEREVPTITTSLGAVPLTHASAGIQRMTILAYMLVWAWASHERWCASANVPPERRLVIMIDEIEAHLHPKWQRTIVPSTMSAIRALSEHVLPQVHIATHSPLILGSMEPSFDFDHDSLHHLRVTDTVVELEQLPFVRQGRFEAWLSSQAFDEVPGRSVEAEAAIASALSLMERDESNPTTVREAHEELVAVLAQRDSFWPRWLFWAEQRGAPV